MKRTMQVLFGWSMPLAYSSVYHGKTLVPVLLASLALTPLCGCAAKRLKVDFTGFEKAYAETSNRELLLNLARLENRDPTYFFKIGQITSAYKMSASVTGNGNYAVQSTDVLRGGPTGGGTPGVTYENDPIFTFIPVNDETNAQLLLKPVPAETFYFLYQQGWRVDQLVRLMVDRIDVTRMDGGKCTVEEIRNTPPSVYLGADGKPDPDYSRDQEELSSYVTFLRVSAIVYWLQKHGHLLLQGKDEFVPYSANSGIADDKNPPKGADIVNAAQKGAVWRDENGKWTLGEMVPHPMLSLYPLDTDPKTGKLVPNTASIRDDILSDQNMSELSQGPALDMVLRSLASGFTIEESSNHQDFCAAAAADAKASGNPGGLGLSTHLVLRSLLGLMAAAAQEQGPYDFLEDTNPVVPNSRYVPASQTLKNPPRFAAAVPDIERIPLLRLTGAKADNEDQPVIQVSYGGKMYRIADSKLLRNTDNQYWNRDVFRLIDQLTSQVTVDISKFPLTEILQ